MAPFLAYGIVLGLVGALRFKMGVTEDPTSNIAFTALTTVGPAALSAYCSVRRAQSIDTYDRLKNLVKKEDDLKADIEAAKDWLDRIYIDALKAELFKRRYRHKFDLAMATPTAGAGELDHEAA